MKIRIIITVFLVIFSAYSLTAKEKLDLKIGTYENPPKIFTDENGEISGFWAEITKYIAQQENWEIKWIPGSWNQCLQKLENNEIDIMVDVGFTPARAKRFAFSQKSIQISWTRIYRQSGSDIESILDLEGKVIAGLKGSFDLNGPEGLKAVSHKFDIDCEIIEMESYIQVFDALENGEIDAGIVDKDFGNINETNFSIERTPIVLQPAKMQYAFPKNSPLTPKLMNIIDYQIDLIKSDKNSIYYQSLDKYFTGSEKIEIFTLWLQIVLIILFLLAALFLVFNGFLKKQVKIKTDELREDIAKRKATEKALRENEEKYRKLIETTSEGVWLISSEKKTIEVNQSLCDMLGYSEDEMIGKTPLDFVDENNSKIFTEQILLSKSTKHRTYEILLKRKNGIRAMLIIILKS